MLKTLFPSLPRTSTHLLGALCAALLCLPPPVVAQENSQGDPLPKASYTYRIEQNGDPIPIDLGELAEALDEAGISVEDFLALRGDADAEGNLILREPFNLTDKLRASAFGPMSEAFSQGGASAGAATVMSLVALIAYFRCQALPPAGQFFLEGNPILGRSSMHGVQVIDVPGSASKLGRGQFDIHTTKFAMCVLRDGDGTIQEVEGIAINVRWVFNVNEHALTRQQGAIAGPNGGTYAEKISAEGKAIEVVLMQIDSHTMPVGHPVYFPTDFACIQIFLPNPLASFDIDFPVSTPNQGFFCAGGFCKNAPPWLDATQ